MALLGAMGFFWALIGLALAAVIIYVLVLTIQFLQRGIRALDIYLAEKEHERYTNGR